MANIRELSGLFFFDKYWILKTYQYVTCTIVKLLAWFVLCIGLVFLIKPGKKQRLKNKGYIAV